MQKKKTSKNAAKKRSQESSKQDTHTRDKQPILVPVDFSAHSEAALEYATDLAQCLGNPLAVLHVVHDPGDAPGYYHIQGREQQLLRLEDIAREMLDEFMDKMVKRHSKYTVLKKAE
ncbi:MAG: universal stress protein, partial [Gammaproteobacteria bacterium]|nr:universal stress protein [Gammaproteobacteria bacterium]